MKITTIENGTLTNYDSLELMFQGLSEQGLIIETLEDGLIKGKKGKDAVEIQFGEFQTAGTKDVMLTEVSAYREQLRASMSLLKKQGLVEKPQLEKLAAQFNFLKVEEEKATKAKTPAKETKETKTAEKA